MRHPVLYTLALASLLVQAVFGAVGAAAVLCIGHHSSAETAVTDTTSAGAIFDCCDHSRCEQGDDGARLDAPTFALTPPCDDDCGHCVDVRISTLDMLAAAGQRPDLALTLNDAIHVPAMHGAMNLETRFGVSQHTATRHCRPPWLMDRAQMLRSTRLLI